MNYYKHHIGDYDADTAHLSMLEDGAYRRILSLYYRREAPIPADVSQACRLVRAVTRQEREAVELMLNEFFTLSQDGWRHSRCDDELASAQEKAKANRANGRAGGRPSKKPNAEQDRNPTQTQPKPSGLLVGSDTHAGPPATSHKPLSSSEANASAAASPPAQGLHLPMTAPERIWSMAVALLGEKGRSHVGKLIATYGETTVLAVLIEATQGQPVDPKAWIVAACEARKKAAPKRNGDHPTTRDLLERDPYAEWAQKAGFNSIFEAESAGCGPGNAHKFRDGVRST